MLLKKILQNRSGVSNIVSTILITSLMVSSVALTYIYIIPTLEKGQLNSSISTSSLFFTKMDTTIQSLFFDGENASRTIEIDAYTGSLEFKTLGLNVRSYVNDSLFFPIPGLSYGLSRLTIPSDKAIMSKGNVEYIKGHNFFPIAVTEESSIDPATITLSRPESFEYHLELWYRVVLLVHDEGVGGDLDFTMLVVQFSSADAIRGLHEGAYNLVINKSKVAVNPALYGFTNGNAEETSGEDFYVTADKGFGPQIIFSTSGTRSSISINLIVLNFGLTIISLE